MTQETDLAYLFAGLLAASAVLLLFLPVLRHISLFAVSRLVSGFIVLGILLLAIGAIVLVVLAVSNPSYFAPIAAVTAVLRIGSPTLLYRKIRERFEATRMWGILQWILLAAFLGLAGFLLVHLVVGPSAGTSIGALALSEQFIMALGASALFARFALRVRPQERVSLWPVWLAGLLFSIAFLVVAPYAFPGFAMAYTASGLVGWLVGAVVLWRDR
ncbi:MAG TPA: hypothetical protein VK723_03310 [Thermoplasmata archaeon]|nr:hypothetical protein [Thermoplasmata archaeon]